MPEPKEDLLAPLSPCEAVAEFGDQMRAAMLAPKRIRGDQGEIENHSIGDLIKGDQYLASKCAATRPNRGLRLTKLLPGGTA